MADHKERTLTKAEKEAQWDGATYVAPGIWLDKDGNLHLSVPELLALVQLPDTPANRAAVTAIARVAAQRAGLIPIEQHEES
jgi:hypothetical protein